MIFSGHSARKSGGRGEGVSRRPPNSKTFRQFRWGRNRVLVGRRIFRHDLLWRSVVCVHVRGDRGTSPEVPGLYDVFPVGTGEMGGMKIQHGCSRNRKIQRHCSASRHWLAPVGTGWQGLDGPEAGPARWPQELPGARLVAQAKGPAGVTVGPLLQAGDEI